MSKLTYYTSSWAGYAMALPGGALGLDVVTVTFN